VTAQQVAVKKYEVKLSVEEREQLNTLIRTGKHRARQLMKARILLKADVSEAGEGWSDSQIASALDTSVNTVARTRQRLVEQGFEAALIHKHSPASARPRIFDGVACAGHLEGAYLIGAHLAMREARSRCAPKRLARSRCASMREAPRRSVILKSKRQSRSFSCSRPAAGPRRMTSSTAAISVAGRSLRASCSSASLQNSPLRPSGMPASFHRK
jgi:hypothetical protein